MDFDAFLYAYVRPDDGTTIVICSHIKCAKASALLFTACAKQRSFPEVVQFIHDGEDERRSVAQALDAARSSPQTRRTVAIVGEPQGPSFTSVLEKNISRVSVFRVTAESIFGAVQ